MQPGLIRALFALTLATAPLVSYAGLYKCVDSAGKVSFQEQECPGSSSSSEITLTNPRPALSAEDQARASGRSKKAPPGTPQAPGDQAALPLVEINQASKADLQSVVGAEVAAQILAERNNGRFRDWPDVVYRVVGLSAAQTAVIASISGLTVNGKSLNGAPPDAAMAAMMKGRHR